MNVSLILPVWHEKLDSLSREDLGIKSRLHGVACPQQREPFQLSRFDHRTCRLDDTDQGNWRRGRDVVEDNMRCVCRDQAEVCSCQREFGYFLNQVISHPGEVVCVHEIESLLHI